jgi:hypothetical protein
MTGQVSTPEDISSRGQAIYRDRIRSLVEPEEKGKFVVIDVDSGDYEIDDRDADATVRLLQRRPGAMTWAVRVGYPAPYHWLRIQSP